MIGNPAKLAAKTKLILVMSACLLILLLVICGFLLVRSLLSPNREVCKCRNLRKEANFRGNEPRTKADYRVVNGSTSLAMKEDLPWISFISFETTVGFNVHCTGMVIGRYWVLTGMTLFELKFKFEWDRNNR